MKDLAELRDRLRQISTTANLSWGVVSSGFAALDRQLPSSGFRRGTLVEWLAHEYGVCASQCAFRAAQSAIGNQQPLVVVDRDDAFHPPGLSDAADWLRVLLVRCRTAVEADWAVEQSLRTSGVGAVLTQFDRGDERMLRRWQLAAERSGAIGFIVRHLAQQPETCFSDVRILVTPQATDEGRSLQLEVLRSRQGCGGAIVHVRLDEDAHPLSFPAAVVPRRKATGT